MPLPPHKLVQVTRELMCMAALHSLQFRLDSIPIGLNVLSVGMSHWVYKCDRVVDSGMGCHVWKRSYPVVGCPLIGMYDRPRGYMHLYDWQQCCRITLVYNPHEAHCWGVGGVDHSKYPHLLCGSPSSMVL